MISLNIECNSAPFGNDCSTTDQRAPCPARPSWLAADLHGDQAAVHAGLLASADLQRDDGGSNGSQPRPQPGAGSAEGAAADAWWQLLYQAHATLVLNGHEHVYARFRPMGRAAVLG